ncbi:anosmin-1 [Atheta coriaria]|uniref:anosmin-1 n=1 Tax=Dalotia coriaria TaxID=877792 RepID=UPI0031F3B006
MRGASVLMLVQCAGVLLLLLRPPTTTANKLQQQPPQKSPNPHLQQKKLFKNDGKWMQTHDIIVQTICEARCWKNIQQNHCMKTCFSKNWEKPGSCPKLIQINDHSNSNHTTNSPAPFYLPCLKECRKDSDCSGIQKCCKHHCGSTCQPAQSLQNVSGLLAIPSDIHIKQRKKKSLYIKWKPSSLFNNQAIFYILEQRQQHGQFDTDLLNLAEWSTYLRTGKSSVLLRNFVRPGRWYQFRVASVNENGTQGFSQPITYNAQIEPRPPKAPNVTVGPLQQQNGTLCVELQWIKPQSDAPVIKYKVFWSKRLFGVSALDSVLVLQHSVLGDVNKYVIQDLEPNSMYFIQVQAITQFGQDILRGEKSGYVLNTTNYTNITHPNIVNTTHVALFKIDNLQLHKLYWSKDENDLKARFTWKPNGRSVRYNITWWGTCKNNKTPQPKLTATTRHSHFDVYDLHFDCRYKVNVKETHHTRRSREKNVQKRAFCDTSVTFTTPSCKDLQARYKRLKCKHRK